MTKAGSTHVTMKPDQKFTATATQDDTAAGGQSGSAGPGPARSRPSPLSACGCVVLGCRGCELLVRLHGDVRTSSLGHVGPRRLRRARRVLSAGRCHRVRLSGQLRSGVTGLVPVSAISPGRTDVDGVDGARPVSYT